jgi:hypothetical protein
MKGSNKLFLTPLCLSRPIILARNTPNSRHRENYSDSFRGISTRHAYVVSYICTKISYLNSSKGLTTLSKCLLSEALSGLLLLHHLSDKFVYSWNIINSWNKPISLPFRAAVINELFCFAHLNSGNENIRILRWLYAHSWKQSYVNET